MYIIVSFRVFFLYQISKNQNIYATHLITIEFFTIRK